MGRTRYKIHEPTHPHFVTCTILHWLPIFTRQESVQIIIDCIKFLQDEGYQPKLIQNDKIMIQKINYIHDNPVKRGYVDEAKHWRYSSARDYEDMEGLIDVDRFW